MFALVPLEVDWVLADPETHILHLSEAKLGDALTGSVQVLSADDKRLRVFVRILKGDTLVATVEQMLLHVDMGLGKTCAAPDAILAKVLPIAEAHAGLPLPEVAGRYIGKPRGGA